MIIRNTHDELVNKQVKIFEFHNITLGQFRESSFLKGNRSVSSNIY